MSKHTPGPWEAEHIGSEGFAIRSTKPPERKSIRTITHVISATTKDELRANALLIAAAPELLEAAEMFVPPIPEADAMCHNGICLQSECANCQRIIKARAAIAKAKGEKR